MEHIIHRTNLKEQKLLRKELRNNATVPEAILWKVLKGKQIEGLKFRRQFGVGPYVLDFYCPEIRLCIELDGEVHNSFEQNKYDQMRNQFLHQCNIKVLRFSNETVYNNLEAILETIKEFKVTYSADQTTPNPSYSGGEP